MIQNSSGVNGKPVYHILFCLGRNEEIRGKPVYHILFCLGRNVEIRKEYSSTGY